MTHSLPQGFRFAGVCGGIKRSAGKLDVSLIISDCDATAVGVYTQNQVVAAPVLLCRQRTPTSSARAVVINSGNANACTGATGMRDAQRMTELTAEACGKGESPLRPEQVLVMSTGIIGQHLPMDKLEPAIGQAAASLGAESDHFLAAADGILTTDQGRKVGCREFRLDGRTIRLAGMAKGAGMIGPNMATMLCCVITDAPLRAEHAQSLLRETADRSFNNISVEGHTSTNDTMLLLANGAAGGEPLEAAELAEFGRHMTELCVELAKQIPADGEGATHLIEVRVSGAQSEPDARRIAHTVASSNLVKTAVYGADPNWGRIVSAAGYAGVPIDTRALSLKINGTTLFEAGEPVAFDARQASQSIREQHTTLIELVVGENRQGSGECVHWTSDLTVEYVQFNSEYTT
jgi:glutamate N-acetyltransferase / amino-acid N-acetyltransferase